MRKTKSKTTAILLAVFLGSWTWVYTWHYDYWKWLIGFLVPMILSLTLIGLPFAMLISVGVWIWAIVDTASKEDSWYKNYMI